LCRNLEMDVSSGLTIPDFRGHVTILLQLISRLTYFFFSEQKDTSKRILWEIQPHNTEMKL
jgi:hypothetical protein